MAVGVRKITNTRSKKVIGKFPSRKMNTAVWWESQIERDFIYLLEADREVVAFKGQPFRVEYFLDDIKKTYVPDFYVERKGKRQVVEVKPASKAGSEKNRDIFRCVSRVCEKNGYEFIVVTDKEIRVQPRLDNVKLLFKYSRTPLSHLVVSEVERYLREKGPTALGELMARVEGATIEQLLAMTYHGYVDVEHLEPISQTSPVSLLTRDVGGTEDVGS